MWIVASSASLPSASESASRVERLGLARLVLEQHVGELEEDRGRARRPGAAVASALVEQGEGAAGVAGGVVPVGGEERRVDARRRRPAAA